MAKRESKTKTKWVVNISPDWITILNILKDNKVPYYLIIVPEEKALTVYQFVDDSYKVIASIQNQSKVRLEPFIEIEFDLDFVFGE